MNCTIIRILPAFFFYLFSAGCSSVPPLDSVASESVPRSNRIYVVNHGYHTGLIVPAEALNEFLPELRQRFVGASYYEIGWGDRDFYRAPKITVGLALHALFWANGSILHVVAIPQTPEITFSASELVSTSVSDAELSALNRFISESFKRESSGTVLSLGPGIYGDSQFYDGARRYSLFNTCNKWTAEGIRTIDPRIRPAWKLTSGSVIGYLRRVAGWKGRN